MILRLLRFLGLDIVPGHLYRDARDRHLRTYRALKATEHDLASERTERSAEARSHRETVKEFGAALVEQCEWSDYLQCRLDTDRRRLLRKLRLSRIKLSICSQMLDERNEAVRELLAEKIGLRAERDALLSAARDHQLYPSEPAGGPPPDTDAAIERLRRNNPVPVAPLAWVEPVVPRVIWVGDAVCLEVPADGEVAS